MKKYLFTIALLLTLVVAANAQVTAVATGNWSDVATWSTGAVPTAADNVVIPTGLKITIDNSSAVCKDLSIEGTLQFQIDGNISGIEIDGNVTVLTGGSFKCASRSPAGAGNTFVEHTMILKGDLTVSGGALDFRAGSNGSGTANGVLLTFAGSANSNISLTNTTYKSSGEEFNSIIIHKTGGANVILKSGNLYMSNNSSVGGTMLTFIEGDIVTEGSSIWGYLSTSGSNLMGASAQSYVTGTLGRGLSNGGGSVRRTFDVGDAGGIRKLVVGAQAPGNSTGHLLCVKCIPGNANTGSSTFAGGIDKVSEMRYFAITYSKSGVAGTAPSIPLDSLAVAYGSDDGVGIGNTNLRVAYSIDNRATWTAVPQTNPYVTISPNDTSIVGGDVLAAPVTVDENTTVYVALARVSGTTENSLKGTPSDVVKEDGIPTTYALSQNYPNPFNPSTNISFAVPNSGNVKLVVYNALGQTVETLVNKFLGAGSYSVNFDASKLTSGIYFYQIQADGFTMTKKMMLVK